MLDWEIHTSSKCEDLSLKKEMVLNEVGKHCHAFIYCNNSNAWLLLDVGPIKFFHGCRVSCLITQVSNNTHVKIQCFGQGIKLTGWEI